jgi:diketogulonate reductase-like aldo/keto reductase
MEELKAEGKARSIGVSNFRTKDLKAVLEVAKVREFKLGNHLEVSMIWICRWYQASIK